MENIRNITGQVYEDTGHLQTEIGRRVFDALDEESIHAIITDGNLFWFEHLSFHNPVPAKVYRWIERHLKKNYNLTYLHAEVK